VILGDYVIWRIEREAVCRVFHKRFDKWIDASGFASQQIRYGLMAQVVSDIRKRAFLIDIQYGMKSASTDQPREQLMSILWSLATSFTRYVLAIDPANPNNRQATVDRYRTSIGSASQIVGDIYFRLFDECKAARGYTL